MAEIGIIASIIGVAGAGFRLSLVMNAIGSEIASAGLEIHSISKNITLFSLMLKSVGQTLQQPDSIHTEECKLAAKQITDECKQVFDEIEYLLDRVRTRRSDGTWGPTTIQKFKWAFKKHKVTYLLAQLESLKLSLSVMLQILQLGKLMASATKSDVAEAVAFKSEAIQQERVETQNVIIVRYWQMSRLDRLYEAAELEDEETRRAEIDGSHNELIGANNGQLALEAAPAYTNALAKLPVYSLGELDQSLHQIREGKKDMLQASSGVIDPLLDQWTLWKEVREAKEKRESSGSGRFAPSVQNVYEDEEGRSRDIDFHDREDSPRGYFLEGNTTDWRQPHSVAAKQEKLQRRKQYSSYQPSVSVNSSDVDEDRGQRPRGQTSHHHVVDSSSESSDSEPDPQPRRRRKSSGSPTTEKKARFPENFNMPQTYGPSQSTFGGRYTVSPGVTPGSTPRTSTAITRNPFDQRPNATPTQNPANLHSLSSPIPPIHTSNAPNPYGAQNPYSPAGAPPPYTGQNGQTYPAPGGRYAPLQAQRMPSGARPGSQDGKPRSPSRMSTHSSSSRNRPLSTAEQAAIKVKKDRTVYKSATKGLLGAGGIAMFLEALEGLDV